MTKIIIKEACIMILLFIAVVLILGVLFYDYIPMNKTIPNKVSYQMPEEVANELKDAQVEETAPINVIYKIDESQLKQYEKSKNYKPGKINPFGTVQTEVTSSNSTGNTTNSNNTSSTNNIDNNQGYFNNAGSK